MHRQAEKLLVMAAPTIEKLANDGIDSQIAERELDAACKAVKLAYYIYKIDIMKHEMMDGTTGKAPMPASSHSGLPGVS